MHSERNASVRLCPYGVTRNNGGLCVADACMAWEWALDRRGKRIYRERKTPDGIENEPMGDCRYLATEPQRTKP